MMSHVLRRIPIRRHTRCAASARGACGLIFFCAFGLIVSAAAPARGDDEQRVDEAIAKALEFLAREQQASGAWRVDNYGESTAATSLAVMAFLSAGHVPGEGPYADRIDRGIRWVLDKQQPNGMLVHERGHGPMYSHGISTLMLAEVVGMVDPPLARRCRDALEKAIRLILQAQNVPKSARDAGGWRYNASSTDSDLSVTGWVLLALRAAKSVGCDVPAEQIDRAVAYVRNCGRGGRGFGYQSDRGATPTLGGVGILALEVCGEHHAPETLGAADILLQRPLQLRDRYFYYGVYYCSVGMFKVGGNYWDRTRTHLAELLLDNQRPDGSWEGIYAGERSGSGAGRIYCTSLAVLALSVEYQYLPIYQR